MNEKFKAKLEQAAEDYADLLLKRIEAASKDMTADSEEKADQAFRLVMYMANTLERLDRPNRGNETSGQEELEALLEKSRNAMLEALKSTIAKARTSAIRDNVEEA